MKTLLSLLCLLCLGGAIPPARQAQFFANATPAGGGSITFVSAATNNFTLVASTTLDVPSGTTSGDLLVFAVTTDFDHTVSYPSGFTEVEHSTLGSCGFSVAWKLADGTEGASLNFGFSPSNQSGVSALLTYRNVNASPFDLDGVAGGTTGSPYTTPAITPSQNDSMLVGFVFRDPTGAPVFSETSGFPLRYAEVRSDNAMMGIAEKLQTTATSEGVQMTSDPSQLCGTYTLAIAPQ